MKRKIRHLCFLSFSILSLSILFSVLGSKTFANTNADSGDLNGAGIETGYGTVDVDSKGTYSYKLANDDYGQFRECYLPYVNFSAGTFKKASFKIYNYNYVPQIVKGEYSGDRNQTGLYTIEANILAINKIEVSLRYKINDSEYLHSKIIEDSDVFNGTKSISIFKRQAEVGITHMKLWPAYYDDVVVHSYSLEDVWVSPTITGNGYKIKTNNNYRPGITYLPKINYSLYNCVTYKLSNYYCYDPLLVEDGIFDVGVNHGEGVFYISIVNNGLNNLEMKLVYPNYETTFTKTITDADIYSGLESAWFVSRQSDAGSFMTLSKPCFNGVSNEDAAGYEFVNNHIIYKQTNGYGEYKAITLPSTNYNSVESRRYAFSSNQCNGFDDPAYYQPYPTKLGSSEQWGTSAGNDILFVNIVKDGSSLNVSVDKFGGGEPLSTAISDPLVFNGIIGVTLYMRLGDCSFINLIDMSNQDSINDGIALCPTTVSLAYRYTVSGGDIVANSDEFRLQIAVSKKIFKYVEKSSLSGLSSVISHDSKILKLSGDKLHDVASSNVMYSIIDLGHAYTLGKMNYAFKIYGEVILGDSTIINTQDKDFSIASLVDYYYSKPATKDLVAGLYNILHK